MRKESNLFAMIVLIIATFAVFMTAYHREEIKNLEQEVTSLTAQKETLYNDLLKVNDEKQQLSGELNLANEQIDSLLIETDDLINKNISLNNTIKQLSIDNEHLASNAEYIFNGNWSYDYTKDDIKLLAGVMFGECEDSGRWEQMLVGSVVLNRVLSSEFPNTIHDVIYQFDGGYEQYAPRTKRIAECVIADRPISSKDADVRYLPDYYFKLAEILLKYGPVAPEFVVYQAHFNQGKVFWEWEGEEFCYK